MEKKTMPKVITPYIKYLPLPIERSVELELSLEIEIPWKALAVAATTIPKEVARSVMVFNLFGDDKI